MTTYSRQKKKLCRLLASVSLLPITQNERRRMAKKGLCPPGWNCHHLMPRADGGGSELENLSLMRIANHDCLTGKIDHIREAQKHFVEEDRPYLIAMAKEHGAYTVHDIPNGQMGYNI